MCLLSFLACDILIVTKSEGRFYMDMTITEALREYDSIRDMEKKLADRKKELANFIKSYATTNGTKDQNGSYYAEDENFKFGNQAKKSVNLNFDRAKPYFVANGFWEKVVKIQETIDEKEVEKLLSTGEIAPEELEPLCDVKTSYSISVTRKKEEEVVEEPVTESLPETSSVKKALKKGKTIRRK
jgi:hypothetical protein